uniref:Target of myb1 like 2 membrane trafficking protein n=1 Tax=Oncorhynchus kisutch TaxID=8019 RepID=A0A8C7K6B4_ONCKI
FFNPVSWRDEFSMVIEKATDGGLQAEDWTLNMEICDIINETEEGPKDAIRALKKRLSGNRNYREVITLTTLANTPACLTRTVLLSVTLVLHA